MEPTPITRSLAAPGPFWTFNREERNAVAILFGLLTRPGNVGAFADLLVAGAQHALRGGAGNWSVARFAPMIIDDEEFRRACAAGRRVSDPGGCRPVAAR